MIKTHAEGLLKVSANLEALFQRDEKAFSEKIDNASLDEIVSYKLAREFVQRSKEFQQRAIDEKWDMKRLIIELLPKDDPLRRKAEKGK